MLENVTYMQVGFVILAFRIRQSDTQSQAALSACDSLCQGIAPQNLGHEGAEFIVSFLQATYFQERDERKEIV